MRSWILPARFILLGRMACTPSAAQIRNRSCCLPTRGGLEASTGAITTKSSLASIPGKASLVNIRDDSRNCGTNWSFKNPLKGYGPRSQNLCISTNVSSISIYLHLTNAPLHVPLSCGSPSYSEMLGVFFPTDSKNEIGCNPASFAAFFFTSVIPLC